jgi:hypothetical protein
MTTDTVVSNVIPLFARKGARSDASTHFLLEHPAAGGKLVTLCGREGVGVLPGSPQPACEACLSVWKRRVGRRVVPLPEVVRTA